MQHGGNDDVNEEFGIDGQKIGEEDLLYCAYAAKTTYM